MKQQTNPKTGQADREEQRTATQPPHIYDIPLEEIDAFPDHPYQVKDDDDMNILVESIKKNGVITPAVVRKKEDGRYELISGHRRKHACELAGLSTLRCDVVEVTREEAIIRMVDANCQRSKLLPSEKAFAYKMKMDALGHQGIVCGQIGLKSRDSISNTDSGRQVQRYIRLTFLEKPILDLVDAGRIAFSPAVALSYLSAKEQSELLDAMEENDCTPSYSQAIRLKKMSQEGVLTEDDIYDVLAEEKPNQVECIKVPLNDLRRYFRPHTTEQQMRETLIKAMEYYARHLERQRREREER